MSDFGHSFFWWHRFPICACGAKYQLYSWGFEELLCVFAFLSDLCTWGRVSASLATRPEWTCHCATRGVRPLSCSAPGEKHCCHFLFYFFRGLQRAIWNRFLEQIGTEIMQWREWIIWRKGRVLDWITLGVSLWHNLGHIIISSQLYSFYQLTGFQRLLVRTKTVGKNTSWLPGNASACWLLAALGQKHFLLQLHTLSRAGVVVEIGPWELSIEVALSFKHVFL